MCLNVQVIVRYSRRASHRCFSIAFDIPGKAKTRLYLHRLYTQVSCRDEFDIAFEATLEDKILAAVRRGGMEHPEGVTARNLQQRVKGVTSKQAEKIANALAEAGLLERIEKGRTVIYRVPEFGQEPEKQTVET